MGKRHNIIKHIRIIASILLAMIVVCYTNSTMFYHVHTVDGIRVVHSHIYLQKHTDASDSGHSKNELKLIEHLNDITILEQEHISVPTIYVQIVYRLFTPSLLEPQCGSLASLAPSRAPPRIVA